MKKNYQEFLKSEQWQTARKKIVEERKCCEFCGSGEKLNVHHLDYSHLGFEGGESKKITKWLLLLCRECHYRVHRTNELLFADPLFNHISTVFV